MGIKAWSYSRYENFRKCKLRAKLLYVDKLVEPRPPLKPGQTEYPNDRGNRLHEAAELFIKGGVELAPELDDFRKEFRRLRDLYAEGKTSLEGEWGFDKDWSPVAYMSSDVWLRVKIDALVHQSKTWGVIIDYKTGKRYGNEIKHAEQTQQYAVASLLKYPSLERITTELWYTDIHELVRAEYTRDQVLRMFRIWNNRGVEITTETEFPPNPNQFSCQFCRFGPGPKGNGVCSVGV